MITIKDVVFIKPPPEIIERGRVSGHRDWETSKHMREKAIVNAGKPINNEKGKAAESAFCWHYGYVWDDRCMQFHNGLGDVSLLHLRVATVRHRGDYKDWPIRTTDARCLIGPWVFMWCSPGDYGPHYAIVGWYPGNQLHEIWYPENKYDLGMANWAPWKKLLPISTLPCRFEQTPQGILL